jgi:hypothetical protein
MPNEMDPAEKIEKITDWLERECLANNSYIQALRISASIVRRYASGEIADRPVRCGECKNTKITAFYIFCARTGRIVEKDGFCNYSERKDGAEK